MTTVTIYSTKYALTKGIIKYECEERIENGHKYFVYDDGQFFQILHAGEHGHETLEAAVKAAEKIKNRKIASLERQLTELRILNF